ncbi:hypothetical protein DPMN_097464 [Dreissena polymorpha]|uniref:Uncharacterized protein n=1 Tax=Dreissena polymorpha TaxID=45954 RepID=A0A9D4LBR8_DREPO|nr:hypothetical protein DPMN_097464 [Dreissena polymorpha]
MDLADQDHLENGLLDQEHTENGTQKPGQCKDLCSKMKKIEKIKLKYQEPTKYGAHRPASHIKGYFYSETIPTKYGAHRPASHKQGYFYSETIRRMLLLDQE